MQDHRSTEEGLKGAGSFKQNDGKWLKLSDAAKTLGVSEITLRRRVKCGRLAFDFRGGKYYVFIPEGIEASHFLDAPDPREALAERPLPSAPAPQERAAKAVNLLRPYAEQFEPVARNESRDFGLKGPTADQIITILKIELGEKEKEIFELKRKNADQATLIAALEASLEEFMGGGQAGV